MIRTVVYTLLGYLSGSILYANVFGKMFGKISLYQNSADQNPGTVNAYKYGGFWCGTLTLLCDLAKGFLPVFLYTHFSQAQPTWGVSSVLAAPVVGHIFPVFHRFRGGKGIATTFGCLLGLIPYLHPVLSFAAVFLILSVGLRITPNFYRTLVAYPVTAAIMLLTGVDPVVWVSFLIVTAVVFLRLYQSKEEKEQIGVKLLWMR